VVVQNAGMLVHSLGNLRQQLIDRRDIHAVPPLLMTQTTECCPWVSCPHLAGNRLAISFMRNRSAPAYGVR
jgi:hypothetical protein